MQRLDMRIQSAAALALLGSIGGIEMPHFRSTEKHAPIRGRIVGRDNGKGRKKQPRNSSCECGSGQKAKRCCVFFSESDSPLNS